MEKKQGLFDALPIEVVALIVEFFDVVTLCQFAAVCSKAKVPPSCLVYLNLINRERFPFLFTKIIWLIENQNNKQALSDHDAVWLALLQKDYGVKG